MPLTVQQLAAIRRSLRNYSGDVAQSIIDQLVNGIKTSVESLIKPGSEMRDGVEVETGLNPATARNAIADILKKNSLEGLLSSDKIDFALTTARDVAQGAGIYAKEGGDADVVEAYPAWELLRVYDRDVPRGFRQVKGTLVPAPGEDWESRWTAAGGELINGRMIALKSDDIWQRLGDGIGGYTDTLGNPFPPFAFNSGYDVNNVSRAECLDLGLITEETEIKPADVDFSKLFSPLEAAA